MPGLTVLVVAVTLMVALLVAGVWIAFAVGLGGLAALYPILGQKTLILFGLTSWEASTGFVLVAIPLFVFMGELISSGGLVQHLYSGVSKAIRGVPGGLVQTNIIACTIFAACSGSSLASAATMGRMAYPEQVGKRGYDPSLVLGSVAAGGTLGILIPPSIFFIVYASIADQSVGKLFLAGLFPGLIMSSAFMLYVVVRCVLQPALIPAEALGNPGGSWRLRLGGLLEVWPFVLLIVAVLGGIYGGIATPTEAAGVGASVSLLIALGYRALTWRALWGACLGTVRTTCMIFLVLISAKVMAVALAYYGVPSLMKDFAQSFGSPVILLLIISLVYLVLGTIFEDFSLMIILLPFVLPITQAAGYDPIWFGVYMCMLLEAGLLSPPIGLNLFVIQGATGARLGQVVWGSIPFLGLLLFGAALIVVYPQIALWLPSLWIG
ncbi:MAG: TRAP transporter large permease [Candidatus Methylomirabilia bacterium]